MTRLRPGALRVEVSVFLEAKTYQVLVDDDTYLSAGGSYEDEVLYFANIRDASDTISVPLRPYFEPLEDTDGYE